MANASKKNSGNAPSIQLYYKDLYQDIVEHPNEIAGAWIKILCKIWHAKSNGKVTKPIESWARVIGESVEKTRKILGYIGDEGVADITEDNGKVTIINRRTVRDAKLSNQNRLRQQTYREKQKGNGEVTPDNPDVTAKNTNPSTSTSISTSSSEKILIINKEFLLKNLQGDHLAYYRWFEADFTVESRSEQKTFNSYAKLCQAMCEIDASHATWITNTIQDIKLNEKENMLAHPAANKMFIAAMNNKIGTLKLTK